MAANTGLPAGSHAVLIGVSAYEYAEFPPIRAARNSLEAMQSLLTDPALCGWPPELITVIANPISASDLAVRLADLAETTTGVLLLYYVGHGVLSPRGELCLTVTSTRPNRQTITGLPWETLAEVLRTCPARPRLVILDCCFAGRAIEALGADSGQGLADITHIDGVYTLAATTRNRTAHVPPASQQDTACTSFTGELHDLIRSGIPGKPPQLTFSDIYPDLHQRLAAKGLPKPDQRGTDTAQQFPFTANTATRAGPSAHHIELRGDGNDSPEITPKRSEPGQADRARQARILTDALRAAWQIPDEDFKAQALARIAGAVAATDPGRAGRLIADAERIAWSIQDEGPLVLISVTRAVAATDPDRAERIARSISSNPTVQAMALAIVAGAVAATDPDRAERIADATDPDRAERMARSFSYPEFEERALADIARAVAATDPDRAERIDAQSISSNPTAQALALADIARAVAATDPDRAERIAQSISYPELKALALADIAGAVAAADPGRAGLLIADAEEAAQSIDENYGHIYDNYAQSVAQPINYRDYQVLAWARIAGAVAATDPGRAGRSSPTPKKPPSRSPTST